MTTERRALYEADIARLEVQITDTERGRKNLVWVLAGCLALAAITVFFSPMAAFVLVVLGGSVFGCGHYICMMHVIEWRDSVERNRRVIEEMSDG